MLAVVTRGDLDDLQAEIVAVRLVDEHLGRNPESLAQRLPRITVVVQDALHQRELEAVVGIGQMVRVADLEADGARALVGVRHLDRVFRRVHADPALGGRRIPELVRVETVAASDVDHRPSAEPPAREDRLGRALGREAAAEARGRGIEIA